MGSRISWIFCQASFPAANSSARLSPGHYRPALLLADEPTGNLDQKNSREIIDLLKLSNRSLNQTILLITHDEKIALEADRIIVIEDGRIISDQKRGK